MTTPIRFTLGEGRSSPSPGGPSRFIVPVILAATGIGIMVWEWQRAFGSTWWERYVPYLLGGLFLASGLSSIVRELRRSREREADQRALREHAAAPWRVRPEWRSNELVSGRPLDRFFVAFTVFWNLVSWPLAVFVISSEWGSGDQGVWLVTLFPAIGLGMAGKLALELLRGWKFGGTLVALDTMPLRLGGRCQGRMRVKLSRGAMPEGGFLVKVSCYRQQVRYRRDSDGDRRRRIERDLLWRDESRFRGDPTMDGTHVEVPFAFDLPEDQPTSTPLKLDNRILWEVSAEAAVPGIDLSTAVEVPVFPPESGARTSLSGDADAEVEERGRAREQPVEAALEQPVEPVLQPVPGEDGVDTAPAGADPTHVFDRPLSEGILLLDEPDRFELHFTAARKRTGAVIVGVFGVVFLLSGFPLMAASFLMGLIFLLVGGVLVYGSIQQGTNDTVLRVRNGQVSVSHDGVGMPADVRLPADQVRDVVVELGTGTSENARYAITLVAREGAGLDDLEAQAENVMGIMSRVGVGEDHPAMEAMKEKARQPRIAVADDFSDKDEADWLASRIRQAIRDEAKTPP